MMIAEIGKELRTFIDVLISLFNVGIGKRVIIPMEILLIDMSSLIAVHFP
jgi:hypothetical protein